MAGGPPPHPHPSRRPRRPTHWPTRRTSVLCPKPGSKWSSSWVVAQPVTAVRGLCSMWRGPPTPGCRTSCLSTWMSGGHSSFWLESLTAPSCCLGRNTAYAGLALPCGRPSARRGPWYPVYPLLQVVFPPGQAGCRPHLKCQLWTFVPSDPLAQLSQAAWGQGLNLSDLNPAHCAWGPAPGAGTVELQTNKVKKLSFQSGFYFVWWGVGGRVSSQLCLGALLCPDSGAVASSSSLEVCELPPYPTWPPFLFPLLPCWCWQVPKPGLEAQRCYCTNWPWGGVPEPQDWGQISGPMVLSPRSGMGQ